MPDTSSQTFLRELDELKERGRLAHSYKFTSLGRLIDVALEAVEKENPKGAERGRSATRPARKFRVGTRINLAGLIDLIATIPFCRTIQRRMNSQFAEGAKLEAAIRANLKSVKPTT